MSDKTTQVVPVVPLEDGRDDITVLRNRIEELERLLPADGVHSCGPHCTRLGCVQRRKIEQMEADALWRDVRIEELEELEDRVKNGFQGGCWCCEIVGEKNIELQRKYEALVTKLNDIREPHESWGHGTDYVRGWEDCRDMIKEAILQSSHPVKNDDI